MEHLMDVRKDLLEEKLALLDLVVDNDRGNITSSVLFECRLDGVTMKGTDRHVMAKIPISSSNPELSVHGKGSFTVDVDRLKQWVENVFDDEVSVSYSEPDNKVKMTCGEAEGYFRSLSSNTFPSLFEKQLEGADSKFECDIKDLLNSLSFVEPFVGSNTDSSNPSDQYKVAQLRGNTVMGTDSQVLAVYESSSVESDMRIGKEELEVSTRFLRKLEGDKSIEMKESEDTYFLEMEDGLVFGLTKPISEFPQTSQVPTELVEGEVWDVSRQSILRSIKALTATADSDDNTLEVRVSGSGEEAEMHLSMKDSLGEEDSTIKLTCDRIKGGSEEKDFRIAHPYLSKSLDLYNEDTVKAAFTDKYFKLYSQTEDGDVKVSLITLHIRNV